MGRRRRWRARTMVGVSLLVAGALLLGWTGWQFFGTNLTSDRAARHHRDQLVHRWTTSPHPTPRDSASAPPAPVTAQPGQAFALLRIPRFGSSYEVPILEGVQPDELAAGVGHFPGTAMPGQVGNFAIAGHRVTHGEPFRHLLDLRKGDSVIVETANAIYTYAIDRPPRDLTVDLSATWVLDPVPGKPDKRATTATITLATCRDLFHSPDRSVGFGHLVDVRVK